MILKSKEQDFRSLFAKFVEQYMKIQKGQEHLSEYAKDRETGRKNFEATRLAANAGENVTDRVLQRLLPHTNSSTHRTSGAWIHIAPAITGNVKEWYEKAGWTRAEDWHKCSECHPRISLTLRG